MLDDTLLKTRDFLLKNFIVNSEVLVITHCPKVRIETPDPRFFVFEYEGGKNQIFDQLMDRMR